MPENSLIKEFKLKTPVAFLVFNRTDTTLKVFEEIRLARPSKLYLIADGPREGKVGEKEKCEAVRSIIDKVDWPCEVKRNYSDINLGCKLRVSSGIDWVFQNEEEAIFLEDDCLPHPTFFRFCEELLEMYRNDERVGMISGDNYLFDLNPRKYSYYFSIYPHIWGWASWRRAWKNYDVSIKLWEQLKGTSFLHDLLHNRIAEFYWGIIFRSVSDGKIDTWDYQWVFACWQKKYFSVTATVNLVSNIGFGDEATHKQLKKFAGMKNSVMEFPLSHTHNVFRDIEADKYIERNNFSGTLSKWSFFKSYIKELLKR
jgi:hypothetical protein